MNKKSYSPINNKYKANAKINLFLHITGKRDDGYHLLDSLCMFASNLYDEITIENSGQFSLNINNIDKNQIDLNNNTVTKSIKLLESALGKKLNYKITIDKNIPIGAGIGGGSADAACIIRAILELNQNQLSIEQIKDISVKIGADVFPCFYNHSLYFNDIGERITLAKLPEIHSIIINPKTSLITKDVFAKRKGLYKPEAEKKYQFTDINEVIDFLKDKTNDLLEPASELLPIINNVLDILKSLNGCVYSNMSGSGASCFALFNNEETQNNAYKFLTDNYSNWLVFKTLLI